MTQGILIAEDDRHTAALLARYFRRDGFETLHAGDGRKAISLARQWNPRLIVLDLMLPHIDGWEVCDALRRESQVPILILSARQEEADRLLGLSLGADDYVVKPFSPREVVARAHAILRRVNGGDGAPDGQCLRHGTIELNPLRHTLTVAGGPVSLTPSEFTLLQALMENAGRVLTREHLVQKLYPGGESVVDRVVDVHVGKVRRKLRRADGPDPIETVRSIGYRLA